MCVCVSLAPPAPILGIGAGGVRLCVRTQLLNGNLHDDLVSTGKAAHPFVYRYLVFTGNQILISNNR